MKRYRIIPTKETIEQELESDTRIKALWLELNEDEVRFVCKLGIFIIRDLLKSYRRIFF